MKSPLLYNGGAPSEDDMISALATYFDAPKSAAISWLTMIHIRFDAKAAAERLAGNPESGMLLDIGGGAV